MSDLEVGCEFWVELKRVIDTIAGPLGAEELAEDMERADRMLRTKCEQHGIKIPPKKV